METSLRPAGALLSAESETAPSSSSEESTSNLIAPVICFKSMSVRLRRLIHSLGSAADKLVFQCRGKALELLEESRGHTITES